MIPYDDITAWGVDRPWPTREQVEQDLLLSRAVCAIASDPYLEAELVFRGGTALHKLHLDSPRRYSEDLDYVRTSGTGIQPLTSALTRLGEELGFVVRTRVTQHPKVYWGTTGRPGCRCGSRSRSTRTSAHLCCRTCTTFTPWIRGVER